MATKVSRFRPNIFKRKDGSVEVYGYNAIDPNIRETYLTLEPYKDNLIIANDFVAITFGVRI